MGTWLLPHAVTMGWDVLAGRGQASRGDVEPRAAEAGGRPPTPRPPEPTGLHAPEDSPSRRAAGLPVGLGAHLGGQRKQDSGPPHRPSP